VRLQKGRQLRLEGAAERSPVRAELEQHDARHPVDFVAARIIGHREAPKGRERALNEDTLEGAFPFLRRSLLVSPKRKRGRAAVRPRMRFGLTSCTLDRRNGKAPQPGWRPSF
jgi:hypothetical protein